MKKKTLSIAIQGVLGATLLSGVLPNAALAQQQDRAIEEVYVTGSRLSRPDIEAVSPVNVIDAEEFILSGNLNVEQKLNELPSVNPSFGPSSNNPGDGTATVDLRGLGTERTLVLVNGRRYIPARNDFVVDLNSIPGTLIERVDVSTGGASAVYGSDAVSGVVNFVLKDDFEGVEITGLYDTTSEGDADRYNFDITMGGNFDDGRGNAVLFASYSKRDAVYQGDRSFSDVALTESGDELVAGGSSGIPGTRVFSNRFGSPIINPDGIAGNGDEFSLGRFLPDGSPATFTLADRFNYAPDNFLQLPQERYLISSMAHYDVFENHQMYAEMTFSSNRVPQELAPTPAFTTVTVNPDSPFFNGQFPNPQDIYYDFNGDGLTNAMDVADREADAIAEEEEGYMLGDAQTEFNAAELAADTNGDGIIDRDDTVTFFVGRRMVENGPRQSIDERQGFRTLVGMKGEIAGSWEYDTYYSKSSLTQTNLLENDVSASRFIQAILVEDGDADGNTVCVDPSNGCAPLNIFGEGNISQEAIDFIRVGASNITTVDQEVFQATAFGELFTLPGSSSPAQLLIGYEHRQDESDFRPDTFLSTGDVLGFNAGQATSGKVTVEEFFTEFTLPILSGVPGAERLELWGAARASDYSSIGSASTYAASLTYSPVEKVTFRTSYNEAIRAPNILELFGGLANGFPGAVDPCADDEDPSTTISSETAALCSATGVTAGSFVQANSQIEGLFGGNPDLQEESSETFTFGVILEPIEGLDITIDYYEIEITDAIDTLAGGVNNILDQCYNIVQDINSVQCQAISRRVDGNVDTVLALNANTAALETSGVDLEVNYVADLGFGIDGGSTLSLNWTATYLDTFDSTPDSLFPDVVNECAGSFGNTCLEPLPELKWSLRSSWNSGPLTISTLLRYIDEVTDDQITVGGADSSTLVVPTVDSEFYLDISAAYRFSENLRVNFGVNNILDTEPTRLGDSQQQANTYPETYTVLGPRLFMSASYKF